MTKASKLFIWLLSAGIFSQLPATMVQATAVANRSNWFESLEAAPNKSRIGGYNLALFTYPNGGASSSSIHTMLDGAKRGLPAAAVSASAATLWTTSNQGSLTFYDRQFAAPATINIIILLLDLNDEGRKSKPINLESLTIYKNGGAAPAGLDRFYNDLSSEDREKFTDPTEVSMLKQLVNSQYPNPLATGGDSNDWVMIAFNDLYGDIFSPSDTLLFNFKISGLDNGPESLSLSGKLSSCDFDPNGCGATTGNTAGDTGTTITAGSTTGSSGRTAGGTEEIPKPASLILLIVGLIGLSRLRGRPVKR